MKLERVLQYAVYGIPRHSRIEISIAAGFSLRSKAESTMAAAAEQGAIGLRIVEEWGEVSVESEEEEALRSEMEAAKGRLSAACVGGGSVEKVAELRAAYHKAKAAYKTVKGA